MKIVMLEPLGVTEEKVMETAKPLVDAGHEFVFRGTPFADEAEKMEAAKDADVLIIANSPLTANIINAAPKLKLISVGFTGVDHVDLEACKERGIRVSNAQGYATESTAELALAMMLACLRNIVPYNQITRDGGTLHGFKHNTLQGKTVGIIGTGAIGCHVAKLVKAFGCKILGYDPYEREEAKKIGIEYAALETLLAESDIISLHAPLMESTKGLIGKEQIERMKESAILINCARGPLVDSEALAKALNEDRIARAGIDVFEMEPPIPSNHPLLHAKNTIVCPHVAFYSEESLATRVAIVCENVTAWLEGNPINVKL